MDEKQELKIVFDIPNQQRTLNAAHIDQLLNGNSSRRRPVISQHELLDGWSGS